MYSYLSDRLDVLEKRLEFFQSFEFNTDYQKKLLIEIEKNIETDITISFEGAKSFLEGLLKAMLFYIDEIAKDGNINTLYKECCQKYKSLSPENIIASNGHILNEDRNASGDMSHGKNPLVLNQISKSRQLFYLDFCFAVSKYCINAFIEEIDNDLSLTVQYENENEFNNYLDDIESEFNDLLLSKGIKTQYSEIIFNEENEKYIEDLANYNDEKLKEKKTEVAKDVEIDGSENLQKEINLVFFPKVYLEIPSNYQIPQSLNSFIEDISKKYNLEKQIIKKDIHLSVTKDRIEIEDIKKSLKTKGYSFKEMKEIKDSLIKRFELALTDKVKKEISKLLNKRQKKNREQK